MHWQYLNDFSHYLNQHPSHGLIIAFLVAFVESLPILGTIFPGAVFMTAVGVMAGRGDIDLTDVLIICTLAAFVGDCIGFVIGYVFKERLARCWPFTRKPEWLDKGRDFFAQHGGKGVIIGRFIGPVRSSIPLIAGMLHMSWWRFFAATTFAAFAWAFVYLLPGVLIGAISMHLSAKQGALFVLYALAVVLCFWGVFWLMTRFFVVIKRYCRHCVSRCWFWAQRHFAARRVIRWITNQTQPDDYHQLSRILVAFLCLIVFGCIWWSVVSHGTLVQINEPMYQFLQNMRTDHWDRFFIVITGFGERKFIFSLYCIMAAVLICKRQWRALRYWLIGVGGIVLLVIAFKAGMYEARPPLMLHVKTSSSFPSGHTTMASFVFGLLAYWTALQSRCPVLRRCVYAVASVLIFCVGLSRLVLGAHWTCDVLAGWSLAMTCLLLLIVCYRRRLPGQIMALRTWLVACACAVVLAYAGMWYIDSQHMHSIYQRHWKTQHVTAAQWQASQLTIEASLPIFRENRVGRVVAPFNVRWLGQRQAVMQTLEQHGWQVVQPGHDLKSLLLRLVSPSPIHHLPYFSLLYKQRPAVMTLFMPLNDSQSILVLHLWDSGYRVLPNQTLWLGTVTRHAPKSDMASIESRYNYQLLDADIKQLANSATVDWQVAFQKITAKQMPVAKQLRWTGMILRVQPAHQQKKAKS